MSLFNVKNAAKSGPATIEIYEQIGLDWWTNDGMTAKKFAEALKQIPSDQEIIVAINSEGGNVWDGLAIYHQLQARKDRVTCRIDGCAASIASVIACAGKSCEMPENALMMIHNPWSMAVGDSEDLRKAADALDTHKDVLVGIYHNKTGKSREDLSKMMDDETWMTGTQAFEHGFANTNTPALLMAASSVRPLNRFRNPPNLAPATGSSTQPKEPIMEPTNAPAPVATPAPEPSPAPVAAAVQIVEPTPAPAPAARFAPLELPGNAPAAPVASNVVNIGNRAMEIYARMVAGQERSKFRSENGQHILAARMERPEARSMANGLRDLGFNPQNANTIASGLVNDVMADGVSALAVHNRLMVLASVLRGFSGDPMKPKTAVDIRKATAASTTLKNTEDFEAGNSTLDVLNVTVDQYSQPFQMSNDDLQKGFRLEHIVGINANAFADSLHDATTTLMTAANFGSTTIVTGAATTWTSANLQSKLAPILAAAKNYDRKVLALDGGHMAYLLPLDRNSFAFGEQGAYGFDSLIENNRWTGAQTNACGFVSNGQAIAAVSGVPFEIQPNAFQSMGSVQLKNGLVVTYRTWFSWKTRTIWGCYDIIFGAGVLDGTGGRVIITA